MHELVWTMVCDKHHVNSLKWIWKRFHHEKRPKGFVGILEIRNAFKQQKGLNRIIVIVNHGRKELTRRLNS